MLELRNEPKNTDVSIISALKLFDYLCACHRAGKPKPYRKEMMAYMGWDGSITRLDVYLKILEKMNLLVRVNHGCWHLYPENLPK